MALNITSKPELRSHFLRFAKDQLAGQSKQDLDSQIHENLWLVLSRLKGTCAAYKALDIEPNLDGLTDDAATGVWAFPKVSKNELEFYKVDSQNDFVSGTFGVLEPKAEAQKRIPTQDLAAIIVPAIAYDRKGTRLGRGKGYYDRTLKDFLGPKIGVCYAFQVTETLPNESHDSAVDMVVTDKFILVPAEQSADVKG